MEVILAQPRGFCAGVIRAIKIVEQALERYGHPVYVLHEIVHNRKVVEDLKRRGALFVDRIEEIPFRAITIFSAHGVSTAIVNAAERRNLRIIDATCPLVTKVQIEAQRFSREGSDIIIIGHPGHPEVEGTRGRVEGGVYVISSTAEADSIQVARPDCLSYVTQTTFSAEGAMEIIKSLKRRFHIQGSGLRNVCYATQMRQDCIRRLARSIDLLLVVGARNSSNSNRLREVGQESGTVAYLIENADDLNPGWFSRNSRVGITAGTSTPEELVQDTLETLASYYPCDVREMFGEFEPAHFDSLDHNAGEGSEGPWSISEQDYGC